MFWNCWCICRLIQTNCLLELCWSLFWGSLSINRLFLQSYLIGWRRRFWLTLLDRCHFPLDLIRFPRGCSSLRNFHHSRSNHYPSTEVRCWWIDWHPIYLDHQTTPPLQYLKSWSLGSEPRYTWRSRRKTCKQPNGSRHWRSRCDTWTWFWVCYRNHDSSIYNQKECTHYQHHRCQYLLVYHHTSALFEGKVRPVPSLSCGLLLPRLLCFLIMELLVLLLSITIGFIKVVLYLHAHFLHKLISINYFKF